MFNLKWGEIARRVFFEIKEGLLGDVSCENFTIALDIFCVPRVAIVEPTIVEPKKIYETF
ncbi:MULTISPECIES: hypothetical protein [Candidatus Ichthyocystis]|uniref:hypothetical protein n=1 Tax=Candidatus Ichthyocystis TaxID=2929841 RepID=UPI000B8917AD|nr:MULTISPECIES: hypothetical protein [Ichthyocystis]